MKISGRHLALSLLITSAITPAQAEVSGNIALVSNYLSYGLSQTQDDPALQLTATWSGATGLYLGGWASQVDFGEGTNTEFGISTGYYTEFSDKISLDIGAAQFLYEGTKVSRDYNYGEIYALLATQIIDVAIHYSWDYFGSDAEYTILQVSRAFSVKDWLTITIGADYSATGDKDKYAILGESNFLHYYIRAEKDWIGLQWRLSVHDTDMPESETDSARVIAGVSWSF